MANLPFMLGAAAGIGLVYLFKKNPSKQSKQQHQNTENDTNNSFSKQVQTENDKDNLD